MSSSRLHFIGGTVGGGFGGKVDSIVEPMAVLGALLTGRPVKFQWDREEEMQVGSPRGAERWYIKDGVMNDGTIVAREFTGFFDCGAYTRLSSYAIQKGVGHLPGPYSIPNVAANVYCVYTNRTPATAMRGFGITGVDFAIESHMDRVAEAVGMNPIDLRIKNAYRDGDMKAHRRVAKNTALIECCQVAAEKARWPVSPEFARASSLQGGGTTERAAIPETAIDTIGKIGDRRQSALDTKPASQSNETVPAGQASELLVAVPPQHPHMQIDPERVGHKVNTTPAQDTLIPSATTPSHNTDGTAAAHDTYATPSTVARQQASTADNTAPTIPEVPDYAKPFSTSPTQPFTPDSQSSTTTPEQPQKPYQPEKPFNKGMNRPGAARHLTNRRRR